MQISVSGEKRVKVAPERAEIQLSVQREGSDREAVVAEATATANAIGREFEALKQDGAVERHTVQPLRTYAWKKSRTAPERFTATVDLTARFSDFEALGRYTADLASMPGVRLGWVNWLLTDQTADRLRDECIEGAVKRARERAEAMARAAGAGAIEITEIADPGMLGAPEAMMSFAGQPYAASLRGKADMGGQEALDIQPADIEIGASLQLRFVTR